MDHKQDNTYNNGSIGNLQEVTLQEIDFRKDLVDYITVLSDNVPSSIKDVLQVCERLYNKFTLPFCGKWANRIELHSGHDKKYYSFTLTVKKRRILIHYRILVYFTLNPGNKLLQNLKKNLGTQYHFYFYLSRIFRELNLDLTQTDQEIIELLLNPIVRDKFPRIPNQGHLADLLPVNENTIARRTELMYLKAIMSHFYHIDVSKLGYETYAYIHQDELPAGSELSDFQLASVPIDLGEKHGFISIYQVPYRKNKVLSRLKTQLEPKSEILLAKSYLGFNLTGFTAKADHRWQVLPPIFRGNHWDETFISAGSGFEDDFLDEYRVLELTMTQARMLDLIQNGTTSNTYLSKTLSVNRKYVREYFKYFLDNGLIRRFTMLQNIGLDVKVWITIIGPNNHECNSVLPKIIEHLKFFPFNFLFYTDTSTTANNRALITGLIRIPSSWLVDFAGHFLNLTKLGFNPKYTISKGTIRWGVEIRKTYDFDTKNYSI